MVAVLHLLGLALGAVIVALVIASTIMASQGYRQPTLRYVIAGFNLVLAIIGAILGSFIIAMFGFILACLYFHQAHEYAGRCRFLKTKNP